MKKLIMADVKLNNSRIVKDNSTRVDFKEPAPQKIVIEPSIEKGDSFININSKIEKKKSSNKFFKNQYYVSGQRLERTPQIKKGRYKSSNWIFALFFIVFVLGLLYWGGNYLHNTKISLEKKHEVLSFADKQFVASQNDESNSIDFELMIVSDEKTKNITLTEPQELSIKSKGSITLYNEFSATPQKLLAGTFVSDEEGKAYKIDSSVTIPGYKLDKNKKIIPGQINTNITAFLAGENYNGSPSLFHVTSFKNTTKYNKIYGKLKEPLSGGVSGLVYTFNDKDKVNIDNLANTSFKEDLLKKVKAQVPSDYVLYDDAYKFSYEIDDSSIYSKTPDASIKLNGTLSVVLLNKKDLINTIINNYFANVSEKEFKEIEIVDLNNLEFRFKDKDQSINKEVTSIPFVFLGEFEVVWNPDLELIKNRLLGVEKDETLNIFEEDPGIISAWVKIFPPWKKTVTNNILKIEISVE